MKGEKDILLFRWVIHCPIIVVTARFILESQHSDSFGCRINRQWGKKMSVNRIFCTLAFLTTIAFVWFNIQEHQLNTLKRGYI